MQPIPIPQRDASRPIATEPAALPHGVTLRRLIAHVDARGRVGEIFRDEWATGIAPAQWSMTVTEAGVMRGMHVHIRHDDYFVLLHGRLALGLRDLRHGAPGSGGPALLELRGEEPVGVVIPHGVAHGFLFLEPSTYVLGTSHYYDPADEFGCHWLDPDLGVEWPTRTALLSPRDAALPPMREVVACIPAWQAG